MIQDDIDILVVAETKFDASFPKHQFLIPGFKTPYRLDVFDKSGWLLIFVRDCLFSTEMPTYLQVIPFELNIRKRKWSLLPIYRPPDQNICLFVDKISKLIDKFERYARGGGGSLEFPRCGVCHSNRGGNTDKSGKFLKSIPINPEEFLKSIPLNPENVLKIIPINPENTKYC